VQSRVEELHGTALVAHRHGVGRLLHHLLEQRPFPLVRNGLRPRLRRHLARDLPPPRAVVLVDELVECVFGFGRRVHPSILLSGRFPARIFAHTGSCSSSMRSAARSPREAAMRSTTSGARSLLKRATAKRLTPISSAGSSTRL